MFELFELKLLIDEPNMTTRIDIKDLSKIMKAAFIYNS
jgi:hypothetical protein